MQIILTSLFGLSAMLAFYAITDAALDLRAFLKERARIKRRLDEIAAQGGNFRWRVIKQEVK